jgi:hypothetical protein
MAISEEIDDMFGFFGLITAAVAFFASLLGSGAGGVLLIIGIIAICIFGI